MSGFSAPDRQLEQKSLRANCRRGQAQHEATRTFVLTRALIGVRCATVFEESRLMGTAALEEQLVRLARCYAGALVEA